VDSLVNAAGLTARGTVLDTTPELFDAHIAVNLKAPFFLMQAVVADLVARKAPGTIVNIMSTSAHAGVVTGSVIDWDQNVLGGMD
jgi:NAD(P)-dependent dehydrogenase (short-subunit alcohol dehydrogenase family)